VENKRLPQSQTLTDVLRRINESVDDFLSKPALSPNDRGAFEDYPLHKVAIWGDVAAAAVLIEHGADVNALGEDGDTPLHRAVAGNKVEMMEFLISQGANIHICNRYGVPAFEPTVPESK